MRESRKSKRITWASDANLCQVRLFLSEESPSQVGVGIQDHLQAKTSSSLQSTGVGTDDTLPPGFEGAHPSNQWQIQLSQIPLVKWRCPPKFEMDSSWQVVAGEESTEVDVEGQREMRVLEAVYPRASAIPPNPSVSAEVEKLEHDDRQVPVVPITPVEDEDLVDAPSESAGTLQFPSSSGTSQLASANQSSSSLYNTSSIPNSQSNGEAAASLLSGVEPNIAVAASAALAAISKNNENGNLIDRELLMRILSNPQLIERLITEYGAATNTENIPRPGSSHVPSQPPSYPINRPETNTQSSAAAHSGGPFYAQPQRPCVGTTSSAPVPMPTLAPSPPPMVAPPPKDINYYKSLIQQHGGEKQETAPQFRNRHSNQSGVALVHQPRPVDHKPKIMKPCLYFNTSRGCRNGANCAYMHDTSFQPAVNRVPEVQSAKRMKMDRQISG